MPQMVSDIGNIGVVVVMPAAVVDDEVNVENDAMPAFVAGNGDAMATIAPASPVEGDCDDEAEEEEEEVVVEAKERFSDGDEDASEEDGTDAEELPRGAAIGLMWMIELLLNVILTAKFGFFFEGDISFPSAAALPCCRAVSPPEPPLSVVVVVITRIFVVEYK